MNIKRNIIFALESRKKNGVPVIENIPIRMRLFLRAIVSSLRQAIALMPLNGMQTNNE